MQSNEKDVKEDENNQNEQLTKQPLSFYPNGKEYNQL